MPIATRLTNTGTLLVNGSYDEQTDNLVYDSNLKLYLNASKISSYPGTGTIWTDLSGNGNHATLVASPTYSSGAIRFNASGTGQRADVPVAAIPSGGSQVSVSCWVNLGNPATPPAASVFSCFDSGGNRIINLHIPWSDSVVYWDAGDSGGFNRINTSTLTLAQKTGWHHWAFTLNATAGTMAIYLDGTSIATGTGKTRNLGTVSTATYPCAIANFAGSANWNGSVSSFQIYNVALTAAQVAQNYSATSAPYTKFKTTSTAVYATELDEVTYSSTAPAIKNLLIYTEQFDNAAWFTIGTMSVTPNATTAPNGTLTADTLILGNGLLNNSSARGRSGVSKPGVSAQYTFSVYAKPAGWNSARVLFRDNSNFANFSSCILNLSTGVFSTGASASGTFSGASATAVNVGNGWYRISLTATTGVETAIRAQVYTYDRVATTGNGVDGVYFWGFQFEAGPTSSIYQGIAQTNTLIASGFAKREDASGNMYVTNTFDEFTGAPVFDSSLRIWYDAGQTASYPGTGTIVYDLSGNGNNGTLGDGGRIGGAGTPQFVVSIPSFTGNGNSQIVVANASSINSSTTITLNWWGSFNGFNPGNEYNNLVNIREVFGSTGYRFGITSAGRAVFWTTQSGGNIRLESNSTMITNNTYNLCVTYDGTVGRMYQNGNIVVSQVGTYNPIQSTTGWIGGNNQGLIGANIKYSTFQWYHRALSVDEVTTNFNALRGRYSI